MLRPALAILAALLAPAPVLAQPGTPRAQPPRAAPAPERPAPPPEISRDIDRLPAPVQRMRQRLLEAARTGEVDNLQAAIEVNELPPAFVRGPRVEPLAYLKARDADGGRETLAMLVTMLLLPYARINAGTPQEMYVWPYVAALDPRTLTSEQKVDAYRVVPASQFRESVARGRYVHHRVGIGPDGTWHYFITGE